MAPLNSFAPDAFVPDDVSPEEVCGFVLALAMAHNDLNDIDLGLQLLAAQRPDPPATRCPRWGVYNGNGLYLVRQRLATVHEVIDLVRRHLDTLEHPAFLAALKLMRPDCRRSWEAIVGAASDRAKGTPLGRLLMMVRHKVAFHYDATPIGRAFRARFARADAGSDVPLLSRGTSANTTRFYFADAIAEQAIASFENPEVVSDAAFGRNELFHDLNVAIYFVVTCFITVRSGFREFRDDDAPLESALQP